MLASPIILYDYPKIAPESPGDLFDGTEIDEILTLRVMTMTDDEKAEMRGLDQHARRLLERTESISCESLARLHGVLREPDGSGFSGPSGWPHSAGSPGEAFFNPTEPQEGAAAGGVLLRAGARVRLRPKHRADVFDIALAGRVGVVEAVEHDLEGKAHFAVVIEDDPGRELGTARFPGHRFFFAADEVEPLEEMP